MNEIARVRALPADEYPVTNTDLPSPSLPEFGICRSVVENPHRYARDWKARRDGPVLGYLNTYVPRETLYAAGGLPVRLFGGRQPDETVIGDEYHFRDLFCPFSRDVLAQGLLGRYDYADGAVLASHCLALRETFEAWTDQVADENAFTHHVTMPPGTPAETGAEYLPVKQNGPETAGAPGGSTRPHATAEYLAEKIRDLLAALASFVDDAIGDDDLRRAIDVYDHNRRLLREIYEFRTEPDPRIAGLEAMELVKAGHLTDPQEYGALLEGAVQRLRDGAGTPRQTDCRLMLVGAVGDDRRLYRLVEETITPDATIVIEDTSVGSRDFWNTVDSPGGVSWEGRDTDHATDLARRYLERPPSPSKHWDNRRSYLRELVDGFDVDGALIVQEKRCDLHHRDVPHEQRFLENELDVPTLILGSNGDGLPTGGLATGVESFVERLQTWSPQWAN